MRIHIATDHAGLELKNKLTTHLQQNGHEVVDHGAYEYNPEDDYPMFIISAATAVASEQNEDTQVFGVIFGGSGNGEQIAANKVKGVRAALVWNESTALLARHHNNANIISIGAREHTENEVFHLIDIFIAEPFLNEERHVRRIKQITEYENTTL